MRITRIGSDYITINDNNIDDESLLSIPRVHLIKLCFDNPTAEIVERVISNFHKTNRFVIEDNIRIYNSILKTSSKKYYVENIKGMGLISFFRRNNKVLLNITRLTPFEKQFILHVCLIDILRNIEVIHIDIEDFKESETVFNSWNGNVIISGNN